MAHDVFLSHSGLVIVGGVEWYLGHKRENPYVVPAVTPKATSTPGVTSSAAVTAILIPALAVTTPTSSPASNIIDDEEVRQFVTDHYDATRRRNVDDIVSGYDDLVDYLDYGRRDKVLSETILLLISNGGP